MKANQVRRIESPQNSQFKQWRKLTEPQGVKREGKFLLSGTKVIEEVLRSDFLGIDALLTMEEHSVSHGNLLALATEGAGVGTPLYVLPKDLFQPLDTLGTRAPLLLGSVPTMAPWKADAKPQGTEVFLALQDPGNLGAALRVCEAFSASKVVLLRESCHPFHARALKAAAGSTFRLSLEVGPSIHELPVHDSWVGLDASGEDISKWQHPANMRLLLGEEGAGLPAHLRDSIQKIRIPMSPHIESLNASVALGIALFVRQG